MAWCGVFALKRFRPTTTARYYAFLSGGRVGGGAGGGGDGANYPHRWQQYYGVDFEISDLQQQLCAEFHQIRRQAHDSTLFRTGIFRSGINLNLAQHQTVWYQNPKTDAMILAGIILSGSFSGVMTFILFICWSGHFNI